MRNAKPQCFRVSGKNFTGNEKIPENIYLKHEESPEDRGFCIGNNVMSPYDSDEILSGFSFLVSNFSNLSIEGSRLAIVCPCLFNIVIIRYSPNQIRLKTRLCTNQSDQKFGRF